MGRLLFGPGTKSVPTDVTRPKAQLESCIDHPRPGQGPKLQRDPGISPHTRQILTLMHSDTDSDAPTGRAVAGRDASQGLSGHSSDSVVRGDVSGHESRPGCVHDAPSQGLSLPLSRYIAAAGPDLPGSCQCLSHPNTPWIGCGSGLARVSSESL